MSLLALALAGFSAPGAGEVAVTSPAATFLEDGALLALGTTGPAGETGHAAFREFHGVLLAAWYAPFGVEVVWGRMLGILGVAGLLGGLALSLRRAGTDPQGSLYGLLLAGLAAPSLLAAATIDPTGPVLLLVGGALVLQLRWRDSREDRWMFVGHAFLAVAALLHPVAAVIGVASAVALRVGEHDRVAREAPIVIVIPWIVAAGVFALGWFEHRGAHQAVFDAWLSGTASVPAGGFLRLLTAQIAAGRWFDLALSLGAVVTALAGCADMARVRGSRRVVATFGFGAVAAFLLAAPSVLHPAGAWLVPGLVMATMPALSTPREHRPGRAWCLLVPLLLAALGIVRVVHTVIEDPRHGPYQQELEGPIVQLEMRKSTVAGPPEAYWALGFDRRVIRTLTADPPPEFVFTDGDADAGSLPAGGDEYRRVRDGARYDVHRRVR